MPINVLYWICYLLMLLSGGIYLTGTTYAMYGYRGGSLLLLIMLFLIGWRDFGRPVT